MPRDGSGIYTKPYPNVVSGTTIESAVHNGTVSDIETDLNAARPIIAGGTGASNADEALKNVSAEKAAQLVASYDSHLWFPGSFRSAAAASGAPNATSSFVGTAYINEALANPPTNANVVIEARDQNDTTIPGRTYVREKKAGTWGAWTGGIFAAPFDAMAYSGMQVNGGMQISQERGMTGTTDASAYIADNWIMYQSSAPLQVLGNQGTGGPLGIDNIVYMWCQIAKPSLAASDNVNLVQNIEGYRTERLAWGTSNAKTVTIGFWTSHDVVGTYSGAMRTFDGSYSYVFTYNQIASNVWEYKTVTIPGPTVGVWRKGNVTSIILNFLMAAGTNNLTANIHAWRAENNAGATSQVNACATTATFRISGVVVLPGSQAPTAEQSPLIMRPYDQELVTCQRYYEQSWAGTTPADNKGGGIAISNSATRLLTSSLFTVQKRTTPTWTHYNPADGTVGQVLLPAVVGFAADPPIITATGWGGPMNVPGGGATPVGMSFIFSWKADARL